ncbi:hypothetical protein BC332_27006 [Capsicum chinense]|nr:hypothetical protein BC332_27006 [Capsicum chinense]
MNLTSWRVLVEQRKAAEWTNLQVISPDVEAWLTSVDQTTVDVAVLLRRRVEVERGCLYGWCPNLKSRYTLSRKAKKIEQAMIGLQSQGKDYVPFSCPAPLAVKVVHIGEEFDSRKQEEEEVMEALRDVGLLLLGYVLRERLTQKGSRVLVILDDVWEGLHDLKKLGIPTDSNHNYQCKVALTTRLRGVCEAMEAQKIVDVGILSDEEAWVLFTQKAGYSADDPSLPEVAKDVANECKGLPLAIVTVAGVLKRKGKPLWEDALVELKKSAPKNIPRVLTEVYQPLKTSYNHLESDEAKDVFLLCFLVSGR